MRHTNCWRVFYDAGAQYSAGLEKKRGDVLGASTPKAAIDVETSNC
jgi:hypothetical protein